MQIRELQLQNFRGFKDLKVNFPDSNLAVFIGVNGAGKSSILDAIAILLTRIAAELCNDNPRQSGILLTEDDINIEFDNATLCVNVVNESQKMTFCIENTRSSKRVGNNRAHTHFVKFLREQLEQNPKFNLPILVYYPSSRLIQKAGTASNGRTKSYRFTQFYAFQNAFTKGIVSFNDFVDWFRAEEDLENQIISRDNRDYQNLNLEVIRHAIKSFFGWLNQSVLYDKLRVVRTRRDNEFAFRSSIVSSLEINKDAQLLKLEQLSDGEQNLLLIVCDIARRLTIANPSLNSQSAVLREGKGIVLIDEIDAHLHPQWQRTVIPALQKTFESCQFIITTHSPQVLSNVLDKNIFILEEWEVVQENPHSYGRDANSILYEFMGVEKRPEWMQKRLKAFFHLIDAGESREARRELEKLQQFLGTDDPEIVRANTMLEFYASNNEVHSEN